MLIDKDIIRYFYDSVNTKQTEHKEDESHIFVCSSCIYDDALSMWLCPKAGAYFQYDGVFVENLS